MLKQLISVELLKIRRSRFWIMMLLGPIIAVVLSLSNFFNNFDVFMDPGDNGWIEAWTQVAIFMGPFILPILSGIYASLVCRYEYISGGWKQLLALPVSRSNVYISKFIVLLVLLAVTQCIVFILFIILGLLSGVPHEIPWFSLIVFSLRGLLATLPLAAIQLVISIRSRNFGVPLAFNIALTLPAILAANTSLGQFYPWTQPMLAMSPTDETPIQSFPLFYTVVIGVFIATMVFGIRNFTKRDMT
ncbi:MrsE [Aneurinibacillus migulanus]|uniref:MrsE n=2 Tax=Aneurinibacillus migulanus TaxID=47500 RepID=A0A0D1WCR7_ANEMI|nr:ABC transporter permease [Aneurinibacillus migulanus]KIV56350.1 MrsE [Aneurinibacillus migulanus]KIV58164.1 MrsE [Aneurinibacillus migulanus]KON96963.1 MrsE [Aneurinibacillus migulanus]KPD04555.1 MrsE [Aneurinibacillus migulanus]MED4732291.1 ABC transporter permease [Aneurinibacillus migulanus]